MLEKFKNKEYRERNKKILESVNEKAKEWHRSLDGIKWHSKHAKESFKKRKKNKFICGICGKVYYAYNFGKNNTCSKNCHNIRSRKKYREKRICIICNKEYDIYKFDKADTCSRSCGAKKRWQNKSLGC